MSKRVLNVGQCMPDHGSIAQFLKSHFDVEIEKIDSGPDTLDRLRKVSCDLVLINRKMDADYSDGIDILQQIKADASLAQVPVMIISNYKESQDNAVAMGAEYGFGKLELGASDVVARLEPFLKI